MKKVITAIFAIFLVACFLAYCGSKGKNTSSIETVVSESSQKESTPCFSNLKVGQTITFGYYDQDNIFDRTKDLIEWEDRTLEPIEWEVLAVEEDKALLISKYALICSKFHDYDGYAVTWETCAMRRWLNGTFFNRAFGSYDHDIIVNTTVIPDESPDDKKQGNVTNDKVFLLSVSEAEKYFRSDSARKCIGTEYCYAEGAVGGGSQNEKDNWCVWWLRPSYESTLIPYVEYNGSIKKDGNCTDCSVYAVRPAVWIYLNQ